MENIGNNDSGLGKPCVSMTRIWRSNTGWEARTEIDLGHQLVLVLLTRRNASRDTLRSTATVHQQSGDFLTHTFCKDFYQELRDIPVSRVTEGVVTGEHEFHLRDIEKTKLAALRFYGHKPQEHQQKAGD